MSVIYKTTNLINGKIYVGQDRHNNPKYLGSGVKLKKSIQHYGIENFKKEILEHCEIEDLNVREIFWIKELQSMDVSIGYNLTAGGDGAINISDESKKKMSDSLKGRKFSEEHKEKLRGRTPWNKGLKSTRVITDELREKLSKGGAKNKGKKFTEEHKKNLRKPKSNSSKMGLADKRGTKNPFYGKTHTEDSKKKMTESKNKIPQ
jgi:group I intron endonuclease